MKSKTKMIKTNTERYVYHLSYKYYREEILNSCLGRKNFVFAHNTNQVSLCWYKLCLDYYFLEISNYDDAILFTDRERLRFSVNMHYDIWRIDTKLAKKDWYIDYIGLGDCFEDVKENYFIFCKGNIPLKAITLCTLDTENIESREMYSNSVIKTYHNAIIPRSEYIANYGFEPELEFKRSLAQQNHGMLELAMNDEKGYLNKWKQLKYKNISILNAA